MQQKNVILLQTLLGSGFSVVDNVLRIGAVSREQLLAKLQCGEQLAKLM